LETLDVLSRLLTAKEVARLLGVHPNYIYNLATSGELPSLRIGGNRRFRWSEIEAWLEGQRA
jgi:excisionase family DNA binding protein